MGAAQGTGQIIKILAPGAREFPPKKKKLKTRTFQKNMVFHWFYSENGPKTNVFDGKRNEKPMFFEMTSIFLFFVLEILSRPGPVF